METQSFFSPGGKASDTLVREIYDWAESIVNALIFLILVLGIVFRMFTVIGPSMNPTLENQDRLVAYNLFYSPQKGDIVAITQPRLINVDKSKPLIKRVIAVEGDVVEINFEAGIVFVNGKALDEPYILEQTYLREDMSTGEAVTVEKGKVFVMGDNRNDSLDSRSADIGQIDTRYIVGGMFFRYWPLNKISFIPNPYSSES
ncbi:MAG: signal peptidase I [Oscillospiraceae bacterium]|nr:signal peptidase I [Oscillospiraceae bacterium]